MSEQVEILQMIDVENRPYASQNAEKAGEHLRQNVIITGPC